MNTRAIDYITEDFYESLSFMDSEMPNLGAVRELFHENCSLYNMSFGKPVIYSISSFINSIEHRIEKGLLTQFMQRELYSKTEIFGRIAQRKSVYEYSLSYNEITNLPKGINYIQFIQVDDSWRIASMAWNDETPNYKVKKDLVGS